MYATGLLVSAILANISRAVAQSSSLHALKISVRSPPGASASPKAHPHGKTLKHAKRFFACSIVIETMHIAVNAIGIRPVCLDRNRKRERAVQEEVMRRMAEKLRPPSFKEGFSKIVVVRVKSKDSGADE